MQLFLSNGINTPIAIFAFTMNEVIFPADFLSSLTGEPGFDSENFINAHQNIAAPVSIRTNPFKQTAIKIAGQVPWCGHGAYLNTRPSFTFDPLFHAGCYYVQEASSMFIDVILKYILQDSSEPVKVLDLCAAPGGKSTLISSGLNDADLLVANEIIKTRVPVLCDNLNRWGRANTIVSNNDPRDFGRLGGFFDIMLVDAPCSGSGMFRKDPDAMNEWSGANVNLCQQRQERILADALPALKEDGYLIYSTCSYSHEENEDILDWLCENFQMESIRIPVDETWGIVESQSAQHRAWGYRFYPGKVQGEGLFAACLRKKDAAALPRPMKTKENPKLPAKEIGLIKKYVRKAEGFHFFKIADDWMAIPEEHHNSLEFLQKHLYLKKSGIRLGKIAGHELIPDHELALSVDINRDVFLQTDLEYDQAISYLRRDAINLNNTNKGWSLMLFGGQPLGWAKLLPNRVNNYYPKELRIMSAAPKEEGY